MDPSPDLPPVRPQFEGTETIEEGGLRFTYTVGRDHITDPLRELLMSRRPLAVDIETFGLGAAALNLKSVAFSTTTDAVICDPRDPYQRDLIQKSIAYARELLFWNSSFDVPNLARNGLLRVEDCAKVTDGVLYARLAEPDERVKKTLAACWQRYIVGGGDDKAAEKAATDENKVLFRIIGAKNKVEGYRQIDLHLPAFVMGAANDVIHTAILVPRVRRAAFDRLTLGHPYSSGEFDEGVTGDDARALVEREQRINRMLLRRSVRGLRVDLDFLDQYREHNGARIDELTQLLEGAGITVTNARTLFEVLEREDAIPANHPKTATGLYSATAAVLQAMEHPLARAFVARKKLIKVDEDYLAKVVELASSSGRVHPEVKLLGATTGRMSMGNPPIQQFPEPARGIVLADEGSALTSCDWTAIEPVIAANLAGEEDIIARFEDPAVKADIYAPIAAKAGIERKQAKTILLGLLYGLGVAKLGNQLGCSQDEAYELRDSVFDAMPRIADFIRDQRAAGEKHMKICTLSGRILPIPMGTYEGVTSVQTHKSVNYLIQGSAYDMLAETLVAVEDAGLGDAVYLAMHDELIMDTDAADQIRKIMETPPERLCRFAQRVPVLRTDRVDLGERWNVA